MAEICFSWRIIPMRSDENILTVKKMAGSVSGRPPLTLESEPAHRNCKTCGKPMRTVSIADSDKTQPNRSGAFAIKTDGNLKRHRRIICQPCARGENRP